MDIKETGKKLKPFAPVLSVALVTACVAGSLSGYEAPVYAATQEETPVKKEETKEKAVQKKTTHTKTPIIGVAPHVMNVAKDGQAPYVPVANPVQHDKKIYPNDPCPCGSGKKYKKCCGKRA